MFNVTVVNIKDILRYLAGLTLTILIVVGLARYFYAENNKLNIQGKIEKISEKSYIECMDKIMPNIINVFFFKLTFPLLHIYLFSFVNILILLFCFIPIISF